MHAAFLLTLACWYFTPPNLQPIEFDTRLGGSLQGELDGTEVLGSLHAMDAQTDLFEPAFETFPPPLLESSQENSERLVIEGLNSPLLSSMAGGAPNEAPGAGDGTGFGVARFGDGSELIRGVQVKVGDPQFTLIWDNDVDLDLHVIEPGGAEINWEDRKGKQGGELDVDNTKGYGPENVYWLVESDGPGSMKVQGAGPPGVYRWFVAYYGGFGGIPKPTQWQVRVKHAGRVTVHRGKLRSLDERSRTFSVTVPPRADVVEEGPLLPPERL